jgi:hypothetical protein
MCFDFYINPPPQASIPTHSTVHNSAYDAISFSGYGTYPPGHYGQCFPTHIPACGGGFLAFVLRTWFFSSLQGFSHLKEKNYFSFLFLLKILFTISFIQAVEAVINTQNIISSI